MIVVRLFNRPPQEVLDIVKELRSIGWTQGVDFDFKFYPAVYNSIEFVEVSPKRTEFNFYTEKYATLFALKWA